MNTNDLSIVTITWARDEAEEQWLRKSLTQLARHGIPVYVTDGGSPAGFVDFLRSLPNFVWVEAKGKGVWAQARNSLQEAYTSNWPFIFYTEPDKQHFFENGLPQMLKQIAVGEQTGIITASRSAAGFATFPGFQQMTETAINHCGHEIVGYAVDYTYGPFLLNRLLVPYLGVLQDDIGWGWRPYAFGLAKRLGWKVEAFIDDFPCPAAQQHDHPAERLYRMRQLIQNIQGLLLAAGVAPNGQPLHPE